MNQSSSSMPASAKLTTNEAACFLKLSASTLTKMRLTGNGPAYLKLGPRRVVYDIADLERWTNDCRRRSTSEEAAR
ncbi:helix-turn-helix transcriptional regulator [Labrys neptuniae]|uniref:Helix-turn-helix domain-containing protein n=1 Tax=Labrys neptuniae TaxID=376174 RepID=A0ABV3PIL7_9HYPH